MQDMPGDEHGSFFIIACGKNTYAQITMINMLVIKLHPNPAYISDLSKSQQNRATCSSGGSYPRVPDFEGDGGKSRLPDG